MKRFGLTALVLLSLAIQTGPVRAAWPTDPATNVPVDTLGYAILPVIVADGTGGALSAWIGERDNTTRIFAQRVDSSGRPLWTMNGAAVAPAGEGQTEERIISDGAGGAIVVWTGFDPTTAYDIRAQRVSGDGTLLWGAAGVPVCDAAGDQGNAALLSDGAGGAIVAWIDAQSSANPQIVAQRLNSSGARLWTIAGVALSSGPGTHIMSQLISDGAGGAITAWYGSPAEPPLFYTDDIYAQRVNAEGAPLWGTSGVTVCSVTGEQSYPMLVPDGSGGTVIAWVDSRGGQDGSTFDDIFAQRLDPSGAPKWTAGGVGVCTAAGWQDVSGMIPDGAGGAILVWDDHRGDSTQVYAQHIDGAGGSQWTANGVGMFSTDRGQLLPTIAQDGAGGAFIAWMDHRSGDYQVYGQRLSVGGAPVWGNGGIALSTALGGQHGPQITWDGTTGAVVTWEDSRRGPPGIYAQGVQAGGLGGAPVTSSPPSAPAMVDLVPAGPNPSRAGGFVLRFTLEDSQPASLEVMDISGRRISSRSVGSFGAGTHTLELARDARLKPGLYLVRLRQGEHVRMIRLAKLD